MSTFRLSERYDILFELMLCVAHDLLMTPMRSRCAVALNVNKMGLQDKTKRFFAPLRMTAGRKRLGRHQQVIIEH